MRLTHKRKVQSKLNKRFKATSVTAKVAKPVVKKAVAPKAKETVKPVAKKTVEASSVSLTPKQQSVLDIVSQHSDGINPKGIGLAAGQEDAKAASWATGGLKKLVEEGLVEKIQLEGNKVAYKAL
ncbi:MarR family transcriptional regulator [Aliivibrio kagoshimensis]|uniref:MarR family transcriptional regulator n=1 Tax=Aliivibrio kagoshimensis TaxID=2910230 RepID=UPI003D0ABA01